MPARQANTAAGKLLILAIVAVGVALAACSWWFRYSATHRAATFWGTEAARRIRDAPFVEMIELKPAAKSGHNLQQGASVSDGGDMITVDERQYRVAERRDVSRARGMTHMRNALLEDRSYLWSLPPAAEPPDWKYALRIYGRRQHDALWLLFSADFKFVARFDSHDGKLAVISCAPIASGLQTMFGELLTGNASVAGESALGMQP